MSVLELVKRLGRKQAEQQHAAAKSYDQVVRGLADDDAIDEAGVESVLQAAGRSPEQLEADVQRLIARRAAAAKLAAAKALRPKVVEAEATMARLTEERGNFIKRIDAEIMAAHRTASTLRHEADQGETGARHELLRTVSESIRTRDAALAERRKAVGARMSAAQSQLETGVGTMANTLAVTEQMIERAVKVHVNHDDHVRNRDSLKQRMDWAREALAKAQAEISELDAEQARLEAEKLIP